MSANWVSISVLGDPWEVEMNTHAQSEADRHRYRHRSAMFGVIRTDWSPGRPPTGRHAEKNPETIKAQLKKRLWDNLPAGLFSADDIDFMAEALSGRGPPAQVINYETLLRKYMGLVFNAAGLTYIAKTDGAIGKPTQFTVAEWIEMQKYKRIIERRS